MRITAIQYFKFSWLVPIVTSPLIAFAEELLRRSGMKLPNLLSNWFGIASLGVIFFIIPYMAMVIALLVFLQNKSIRVHIVTILLSPVVMTLFISIFLLIAGGSTNALNSMMLYGQYAITVGYSYVVLIFALYGILRWLKFIHL